MFNEKEFIQELEQYEINNSVSYDKNELNAIVHWHENEEDPLSCAIYYGFVLGCMKTKQHIIDLIYDI